LEETSDHEDVNPDLFSFFVDTCGLRNMMLQNILTLSLPSFLNIEKIKIFLRFLGRLSDLFFGISLNMTNAPILSTRRTFPKKERLLN
jgi:hypothetical protein